VSEPEGPESGRSQAEVNRAAIFVMGIVVAIVLVAAVALHPIEVLSAAIVVLPVTATIATWYMRHVYLSDPRIGKDGLPFRSTYLRRSWRIAAAITASCYPIAAVVIHSTLRRVNPELDIPALAPGVAASIIGIALLVALGTVHWKAFAIWRDRRRPPELPESQDDARG